MSKQVTIGGDRLGSGRKMKADIRTFNRSTFDMGYTWRSTAAAGTLIPFLSEVALPGDTFDIRLNADCLTSPTIGPLFGSYKMQLDVFQVPMRLYNGKLHMNMLGIGMDMSQIKIPQIQVWGRPIDVTKPVDNQQINPSSILAYLNIRGMGQNAADPTLQVHRRFNAIPYLGYWDIYKNYYANKQEEIGMMIHRGAAANAVVIDTATLSGQDAGDGNPISITVDGTEPYTYQKIYLNFESALIINVTSGLTSQTDPQSIKLIWKKYATGEVRNESITDLFYNIQILTESNQIICTGSKHASGVTASEYASIYQDADYINEYDTEPTLTSFPLENIDNMRMDILQNVASTDEFVITRDSIAPYGLPLNQTDELIPENNRYSILYNQEGLAVKTYNSDLLNNWINTEWIDGVNGISEITSIDTSGGSFTIDELNLAQKVYRMLNRIGISGGTYDDWQEAVYDQSPMKRAESPMYIGGLIKNVVFQEVVSNSASGEQPLGTLAGRGRVGPTNKGGNVTAKITELSYIIGIISLTPNIDYSQGNKWDMNLLTFNDFHKPDLDQIGFQELITDQMAWWETVNTDARPTFKSAGKQPAWMNYMTNIDVVRGNFADRNQQMFMVLNRRYGLKVDEEGYTGIRDVTTYIDPVKCNYIFADTRRDAQNFWLQVGVDMKVRRKMSSKIMPNL